VLGGTVVRQSRVIDPVVGRAHCCAAVPARSSRRPVPFGVLPPAWCTPARAGPRCVALQQRQVPARAKVLGAHRASQTTALGAPIVTGGATDPEPATRLDSSYGQVVPSPPDPSKRGCCDEYSNPRPRTGQYSVAVDRITGLNAKQVGA
jgi:hypothetical protein